MSSNEYFTPPTALAPGTKARSADVNAISQAVDSAFDRLPSALTINTGTATYAQAAGAGNAYTATLSSLITTYHDGMEVKLLPMRNNTGPATLNVNGIGNIPIKRHDGTDPETGDLVATSPVVLIYVAATNSFRMPPVADGQVAAAAASATAAAQSAGSAAQSSTNASQAAGSASGQATAAAGSASSAASSASAASTSAGQAQGYAQTAQAAAAAATSGQTQADWSTTDSASKAFIKNKPSLVAVATSGAYSDLSGRPSLAAVATTGNYSDIAGKPTLASVATSGNKADIGLGNVDNTSDANKPVSNATATALSGKVGTTGAGASGTWGISISGTAASAGSLSGQAHTNGSDGWFRSTGDAGWYNDTYSVGIYATSANTVRTYNNAEFVAAKFWGNGGGLTGTAASLTAGNTSSVSSATANGYTWTGTQIFLRNSGAASTHATVSDFALIPNSTDGGAAGISFVRGGQFAVNMALDPDNVIRIGGYSTGASRFQFDCTTGANSGNFTAAGNIAATSDERLKDDWQAVDDDFVANWAQVRSGTYRRIDTGAIQVGLGAQSVQRILPQAVLTDQHDFLSLNYGGAAAVATVALAREAVAQRAEIDRLKELVAILIKKAGVA